MLFGVFFKLFLRFFFVLFHRFHFYTIESSEDLSRAAVIRASFERRSTARWLHRPAFPDGAGSEKQIIYYGFHDQIRHEKRRADELNEKSCFGKSATAQDNGCGNGERDERGKAEEHLVTELVTAHGELQQPDDQHEKRNCDEADEEIEHIIQKVPEVVEYLRNMSPVWRDLKEGRKQYVIQ